MFLPSRYIGLKSNTTRVFTCCNLNILSQYKWIDSGLSYQTLLIEICIRTMKRYENIFEDNLISKNIRIWKHSTEQKPLKETHNLPTAQFWYIITLAINWLGVRIFVLGSSIHFMMLAFKHRLFYSDYRHIKPENPPMCLILVKRKS